MAKETPTLLKRLFFAFEVHSPWDKLPVTPLPKGRLLDPTHRHMTLLFLGNTNWPHLQKELASLPPPPMKVGLAGHFDESLFLPPRSPRVVAWHVEWWENATKLTQYQKELFSWLNARGILLKEEKRDFLPHVTFCRQPFWPREWNKAFYPLPLYIHQFHLYESVGNLTYRPIFTLPIQPPFEKIGSLYRIWGENEEQLLIHTLLAKAFETPAIVREGELTEQLKLIIDKGRPNWEKEGILLKWELEVLP